MKYIAYSLSPALLLAACSGGTEEQVVENTPEEVAEKAKKQVIVKPIDPATTIDAGLAIGSTAPISTKFQTKDGVRALSSVLEDGPAVFIFTRSVSWCPFCQTQLKSVNAIVGDLKERGYQLYGVSYDSPDEQDRFSMNQMLDYNMLSDEASEAIDAFELRDPQYTEGRAMGVPYASVIVISQDGKILTKSVSGDYKMRPTNDQILKLIDSI